MIKCFIIINNHGALLCQQHRTGSPPLAFACAASPPMPRRATAHPAACPRAGKPRLTKFYEQLVRRAACARQPPVPDAAPAPVAAAG